MSENDYFDYRVSAMDTGTEICGGVPAAQDGRLVPFYVRGACIEGRGEDLGLSQEELKELQVNEYSAVQMSVTDNGPHGDGLVLRFYLQGRKEEAGRLFEIELEPHQARILISALDGALRMRAAQATR